MTLKAILQISVYECCIVCACSILKMNVYVEICVHNRL